MIRYFLIPLQRHLAAYWHYALAKYLGLEVVQVAIVNLNFPNDTEPLDHVTPIETRPGLSKIRVTQVSRDIFCNCLAPYALAGETASSALQYYSNTRLC